MVKWISLPVCISDFERWQFLRLYEHDAANYDNIVSSSLQVLLDKVKLNSKEKEKVIAARSHITDIQRVQKYGYIKEVLIQEYDIGALTYSLNTFVNDPLLRDYYKEANICVDSQNLHYRLFFDESVIHWITFTFVKNALQHRAKSIEIAASQVDCPENVFYTSKENTVYIGNFLKLSVHDNGHGFKSLEGCLDLREENGEIKGVGLYITRVLTDMFRGHLDIQSVPGNTTVSMYFPQCYEEFMRERK